jgi:hypothetical protein
MIIALACARDGHVPHVSLCSEGCIASIMLTMAQGRLRPEDWAPIYQTRITTRSSPAKEPREERVRIPKSALGRRPTPLDIELAQTRAPSRPPPPTPPIYLSDHESVRDPEIVDLAAPKSRQPPDASPPFTSRGSLSIKRNCPSAASRRSEMSYGILDYYIRDVSPVQSPDLPTTSMPVHDPAIDGFDFGLNTVSNISKDTSSKPDANAGAEAGVELIKLSSPPPLSLSSNYRPVHKKTYSLFPAVNGSSNSPSNRLAQIINESADGSTDLTDVAVLQDSPPSLISQRRPTQVIAKLDNTPARRRAQTVNTPSPIGSADWSRVPSTSSPRQPNTSYRPRKESLSSSIRTRKDSCNSYQSRLIPMRIVFSSSTATAASRSSASNSTANSSPNTQSRWSDDTITSPTAATTPGPRTGFGSLLGRDSAQYPACFFEDDDEEAPLRRKFKWQKNSSLTMPERKTNGGRGRFDERKGFWRTVRERILCSGCR